MVTTAARSRRNEINSTTESEQSAAPAEASRATAKHAAAKRAKPTKKSAKAKKVVGKTAAGRNKKAEVVALMKRAKGATLAEIMAVTKWQPHTVRGFISILGSKGGERIESLKNDASERTYRIDK